MMSWIVTGITEMDVVGITPALYARHYKGYLTLVLQPARGIFQTGVMDSPGNAVVVGSPRSRPPALIPLKRCEMPSLHGVMLILGVLAEVITMALDHLLPSPAGMVFDIKGAGNVLRLGHQHKELLVHLLELHTVHP